MAETISFSSGSFSAGTNPQPGSNGVVVEGQNGVFTLSTQKNTPIVNLGIQGDGEKQDLSFLSDTPVTLKGFTANLEGGDDSLFIGGKTRRDSSMNFGRGGDSVETEGGIRRTELNGNRGKDDFLLNSEGKFVAVDSQIDMGKGNDTLVFGGSVKDVDVNLGSGSDKVEFQGNINGVKLNLGEDGEVDKVRIAEDADIKGLVITGADESDLLFIGSTEYSYDSNNNLWVNSSDPNDTRNFS